MMMIIAFLSFFPFLQLKLAGMNRVLESPAENNILTTSGIKPLSCTDKVKHT